MTATAMQIMPDRRSEDARLAALDRYDILDTRREESFDRIARLIKLTLNVDIAIVSLMDAHRQWYKAIEGGESREVALDVAFCRHILADGKAFVVEDASVDARFKDNPMVTGEAHVRSYAGVPLCTNDGFVIGSVCAVGSTARDFTPREQAILQELASLAMHEMDMRRMASVDTLTGLLTRRAFREDAERLLGLAKRHRNALSAVTFDLDHFKKINDTYGHAGGDQVLVGVARAAADNLRDTDLLARMGGEEFVVLLPHTDALRAYEVAEKLRLLFRSLTFPGSRPPLSVSASFGVAAVDPSTDDIDSLLQKADMALYEAKRQGRNRTSIWQQVGEAAPIERRRVLKAGRIIFNNRHSTIECTVRALWSNGAELAVSDAHNMPDEFSLRLIAEGAEWRCRIGARTDQRVVVEFI